MVLSYLQLLAAGWLTALALVKSPSSLKVHRRFRKEHDVRYLIRIRLYSQASGSMRW
jgi:hypothetical protein